MAKDPAGLFLRLDKVLRVKHIAAMKLGKTGGLWCVFASLSLASAQGQSAASPTNAPAAANPAGAPGIPGAASLANSASARQSWNVHVANTDVVQWHPGFQAQYSGPNSLNNRPESAESVDFDVTAGLRLWQGAEFHADGLLWQGFGLSHTLGIEAFPNAEAYKLGARLANASFSRAFIRQTINLGGETEDVPDDALHLAGKEDQSRLVVTLGELSVLDIFDNNAYAADPTSQFLNWAFVGNIAWDYPASSIGYITGTAVELYQPNWAVRYGFFQVPRQANGLAEDPHYLQAWGMVMELERDFKLRDHPGAIRFEPYLNHAHMGSYEDAIESPVHPADIDATQAYRYKFGLCLNIEQELMKDVGLFSRLGWSDGKNEAWAYTDADSSASLGLSVNGDLWNRPNDTYGLAGVVSALSGVHQQFLEDGGLGILAGDGTLNYGLEKAMETYYNFQVWKSVHVTADYQFVIDPAFNRDRGPVSIIGGRFHWDF
jgi:high affinity Mn2+ porin